MHKWNEEEIAFLRANAPGKSYEEARRCFENQFGESVSVYAINGVYARYGIVNGIDQKIKKGNVPHNKGKKGVSYPGTEKTQFQKGHKPWNYKPIGSERINSDGYAEVKIADPNVWKAKHILEWEKHHGNVPKGYAVVITGENRLDPKIEDLVLVSRKQLAIMNKRGYGFYSKETAETGKLLADLVSSTTKARKKR